MAGTKARPHFRPAVALPKPEALLGPFEQPKLFGYWFSKVRIQDLLTSIRITGHDTVFKADPKVLSGSTYFVRNIPQPNEPADIMLPKEINPIPLGFALAWLHGGRGNEERMKTHNLPDFYKFLEIHWIERYIIMYIFGIEEYANELLGNTRPGRAYLDFAGLVDPQHVKILKSYGMMRSPLGQLLLKQAAWNLRRKIPQAIVLRNCHFDKREIKQIQSFTREIRRKDDSPTDKKIICEFHVHERTKKCAPWGSGGPIFPMSGGATLPYRGGPVSKTPRFYGVHKDL